MRISDYRPLRPIILGDLGVEPEPLTKLSEDQIIAMQQPSTQRSLKRDPKEDEAWFNRPPPQETEWKRDYTVGRKIDPQELVLHMGARLQREHSAYYKKDLTPLIGKLSDKGVSEMKRNNAISALIYTPAAQVTPDEVKAKAVGLVEYKSEPLVEVWVELTWWQALIHRLKGNKIRQELK